MILVNRTQRRRSALLLLGILSLKSREGTLLVSSLTPERSNSAASYRSKTRRASSSHLWAARQWRSSYPDEDDPTQLTEGGQIQSSARLSSERPTLTLTEAPVPTLLPDKPKIVVLGATGKIGRLVIRQLLESSLDATIVACCRDYDKACRVLYDDLLVLASQQRTSSIHRHERHSRSTGPNLQIVPVDLVPPEELPGYESQAQDEEAEWLRRAQSAAKFYKNSVQDYNDRHSTPVEDDTTGATEALEEAIKGCTAIVSCVGAVRPTNLWTDILARPFLRLLKHDVSDWCQDPRHPFYVHYCSTRKVLALAEREQLRREAAAAAANHREGNHEVTPRHEASNAGRTQTDPASVVPRIRFVRISDLCVAEPPWALVPWVTNVFQSMVFRYQDMAEQILHSSSVLETVVVRPGDLVDELRDESTTSLQVGIDGKVPTPARVGREDVAALAVAATLFDSVEDQPFHYTFAVRWAGQHLDPFPSQGCKSHGLPTAQLSLQAALRKVRKRDKFTRRKRLLREKAYSDNVNTVVRFARKLPTVPRRLKPYGLCVAIPVYLFLAMMARTLVQTALPLLPGIVRQTLASLAALVVSSLTLVMQGQFPPLLARLPLRRAAQKYISF